MEWLLKLLESLGVKVEGDLKTKLDSSEFAKLLETTVTGLRQGLFTQEQVDKVIQDRLARERKVHDKDLEDLREQMKKLVDPSKVTEVENQFKGQIEEANKKVVALTKEMKLREAFRNAGVKDVDYLMYQAGQKGLANRFTVDDKGNVSVVNVGADGKTSPAFGKDGKPLEMSHLIDEMKEEFKTYFGEQQSSTPGATNPFNSENKPGSIGESLAKGASSSNNDVPEAWK
jgi:hypothetical protein